MLRWWLSTVSINEVTNFHLLSKHLAWTLTNFSSIHDLHKYVMPFLSITQYSIKCPLGKGFFWEKIILGCCFSKSAVSFSDINFADAECELTNNVSIIINIWVMIPSIRNAKSCLFMILSLNGGSSIIFTRVDISNYQTTNIMNSIKTRKTIMKVLLALTCFCQAPFIPNFKMFELNCNIWKFNSWTSPIVTL